MASEQFQRFVLENQVIFKAIGEDSIKRLGRVYDQQLKQISNSADAAGKKVAAALSQSVKNSLSNVSQSVGGTKGLSKLTNDLEQYQKSSRKTISQTRSLAAAFEKLSNTKGISKDVAKSASSISKELDIAARKADLFVTKTRLAGSKVVATDKNSVFSQLFGQVSNKTLRLPKAALDVLSPTQAATLGKSVNLGGTSIPIASSESAATAYRLIQNLKDAQRNITTNPASLTSGSVNKIRAQVDELAKVLNRLSAGKPLNSFVKGLSAQLGEVSKQLQQAENEALKTSPAFDKSAEAFLKISTSALTGTEGLKQLNEKVTELAKAGLAPNLEEIGKTVDKMTEAAIGAGPAFQNVIKPAEEAKSGFLQSANAVEVETAKLNANIAAKARNTQATKLLADTTRTMKSVLGTTNLSGPLASDKLLSVDKQDLKRVQSLEKFKSFSIPLPTSLDQLPLGPNAKRTDRLFAKTRLAEIRSAIDTQKTNDFLSAAEGGSAGGGGGGRRTTIIRTGGGGGGKGREGGFTSFLPQRDPGTSRILNQFSAAAAGALLATNLLNRNISGLLFSLVFLKFNLVGTALAAASVATSFGLMSAAIIKSVSAFSGIEPILEQFRGLTGSTQEAGAQFEYAAAQARKFGFNIDDVSGALLNLDKSFLGNKENLQAVEDLSAGLGVSVQQASDIYTQAIGLQTGSLESLQQAGIKVTAQQAQQLNQMDRLTRMTEVNRLINEKFSGSAERHAQTLGGSVTRLTQAFRYLFLTIGGPIAKTVLVPFINAIANLVNKISDAAKAFLASSRGIQVMGEISKTVSSILDELGLSGEKSSDAFRNRGATAFYIFFKVISLVLQGILKLIQLIKNLINALRSLAQYLKPIIDLLRRFAQVLKDLNFGAILKTFKEFAFDIPAVARAIAAGLLAAIPEGLLRDLAKAAIRSIGFVVDGLRKFPELLRDLPSKFFDLLDSISKGLEKIGIHVDFGDIQIAIEDFVRSIPERLGKISEAFRKFFIEDLPAFIRRVTSRDFFADVQLGIEDFVRTIPEKLGAIPKAIGDFFRRLPKAGFDFAGDVQIFLEDAFREGIPKAAKGIRDLLEAEFKGILDIGKFLGKKTINIGSDLLNFVFAPRGDLKELIATMFPDGEIAKALKDDFKKAAEKIGRIDIFEDLLKQGISEESISGFKSALADAAKEAAPKAGEGFIAHLFDGLKAGVVFASADILGRLLIDALPVDDVVKGWLSEMFDGALWGALIPGVLGGGPFAILAGAIGGALEKALKDKLPAHLDKGLKGAAIGAVAGGTLGAAFGPLGIAVGATLGAVIGGAIEIAAKKIDWGKLFKFVQSGELKARLINLSESIPNWLLDPEKFKAKMINIFEGIGNINLGNIFGFDFTGLIDKIKEATSGIQDSLKSQLSVFQDFFETVKLYATIFFGILYTLWNGNFANIQGIVRGALELAKGLFDTNFQLIIDIVTAALGILTGIIKIATGVIQATVGTFLALLRGDWDGAWNNLKEGFGLIWEGIKQVVSSAIDLIINTLQNLKDNALPGILAFGQELLSGLTTLAGQMIDKGLEIGSNLVLGIINKVSQVPLVILGVIRDIETIILGAAPFLIDAGKELAHEIIQGIAAGFIALYNSLPGPIGAVVEGVLGNFKDFLGINSPAKTMIPIGEAVIEGLIVGMTDASGNISDVTSNIVASVTSQADQARAAGEVMGQAVADGFSGKFSEVTKKSIKLDDLLPAPNPRVSDFFNLNDRILRKLKELGIDQAGYQQKDPSAFVKTSVDYLNIFKTVTENFGISAKAYTLSFDDLRKVAQNMGEDLVNVGGNIVSLSHTIESFSPIQKNMLDGLQKLGDVSQQQAVTIISAGAAIAGEITAGIISLDQFIRNFQAGVARTTDPNTGQDHPQTSEEFFFSLPPEAREALARLLEELHRQGRLAMGGVVTRATRALVGESGTPEGVVPLKGKGAKMVADALVHNMAPSDRLSRLQAYTTTPTQNNIINVSVDAGVIADERSKDILANIVAERIESRVRRSAISYR